MNNKGMALIIILWIVVILETVVISLIYTTRMETKIVGWQQNSLKAVAIARAGVERVIAELYKDKNSFDSLDESWKTNPQIYENITVGDGSYTLTVDDEESKLNISRTSYPMLERFFNIVGFQDTDLLCDSIFDWRDEDSDERNYGAEDSYYQNLVVPYDCKNGLFSTVRELKLVRGMEPYLFNEIENMLTIYANRININTAGVEVLQCLPGFNDSLAEVIVGYRESDPFKPDTYQQQIRSILELELGEEKGTQTYNEVINSITVKSNSFKVHVKAQSGNIVKNVEAVIDRSTLPVRIIYWRED